jgi:hypothetical protein
MNNRDLLQLIQTKSTYQNRKALAKAAGVNYPNINVAITCRTVNPTLEKMALHLGYAVRVTYELVPIEAVEPVEK